MEKYPVNPTAAKIWIAKGTTSKRRKDGLANPLILNVGIFTDMIPKPKQKIALHTKKQALKFSKKLNPNVNLNRTILRQGKKVRRIAKPIPYGTMYPYESGQSHLSVVYLNGAIHLPLQSQT
jgi:hypothetical protein